MHFLMYALIIHSFKKKSTHNHYEPKAKASGCSKCLISNVFFFYSCVDLMSTLNICPYMLISSTARA